MFIYKKILYFKIYVTTIKGLTSISFVYNPDSSNNLILSNNYYSSGALPQSAAHPQFTQLLALLHSHVKIALLYVAFFIQPDLASAELKLGTANNARPNIAVNDSDKKSFFS